MSGEKLSRYGWQKTVERFSACTGPFTPAATPTDVWYVRQLIGVRPLRVTRVRVSFLATAASGLLTFNLVRRSAINTAGTEVATPIVPLEPRGGGSNMLAFHYTANPAALGTAIGNVRATRHQVLVSSPHIIEWDFELQPIVLRAAGHLLAVNLAGVALPAGFSMAVEADWVESHVTGM